jgi:hypothetical protein
VIGAGLSKEDYGSIHTTTFGRNHLMSKLAPNSGLLGPPSPKNQRLEKKVITMQMKLK